METQAIRELVARAGVVPHAVNQVVERALIHFAAQSPSPAEVGAYLDGLPVWTKLGMDQDAFLAFPAEWRLAQGHQHGPPPPAVHTRRPVYRTLTTEEVAALEGLPWAERRERARAMQQTPPPQP